MARPPVDRMIGVLRRWRSRGPADRLVTRPDLSEPADLERLHANIDAAIAGVGGEVAARRRAGRVGAAFVDLDEVGRRRFFELLADDYGIDDGAVDSAMQAVLAADADQRGPAVDELRRALRPRRLDLLRRIVGLEGGLQYAVELREALLPFRSDSPSLRELDNDFRQLLDSWFDVALLELEQLTWDTPASLLEKLIEYEAVHAIESWADLKGRLGSGRRCYAFTHPAMPGEPLIFVEVALVKGVSSSITSLLDHQADRVAAADADTAIFYSISNCHQGLAGVSLGNLLIKRVVERLGSELPDLDTFATLSPIPGFRRWVESTDPDLVAELAATTPQSRKTLAESHREELLGLAARYLTEVRRDDGRLVDPVGNFHLSNGASVDRLNWWGNPSDAGWDRSFALMVNYRYDPDSIEANHDRYDADHSVARSSGINDLIDRR